MAMSQRMWKREQERRRRERIKRARRRRNCAAAVVLLAVVAVVIIIVKMGNNTEPAPSKPSATAVVDTSAAKNPYTTTRSADDIKASFFSNGAFAGNALAQTIGMYGILEDTEFYADVNADVENVYTLTPSGSTTPIAEQFKSKRFSKVFLSFGENELNSLSSSEFKTKYAALVEKIKKYQPNARIYLIGIPPVTAQTSSSSDKNLTMAKIKEFNKRIMSIAVDEEAYFIDSVDALGDNKDFLPDGVSSDGVNLNKAAVIDLLYYAGRNSYIPNSEDLADMDIEDEDEVENSDETETEDEDKTENSDKKDADKKTDKSDDESKKGTDGTQSPSPSPTVNVLKSTATRQPKEE